MSERLEASWAGHEYWGSVGGAVRGLPFTVQTSRGLSHLKMGLVTSPQQSLVRRVTRRLQPANFKQQSYTSLNVVTREKM